MRNETESNRDDASDLAYVWDALPVSIRVQHRLTDILILADELQTELSDEKAGAIRWLNPEVRSIAEAVEIVLKRLIN